MDYVQVISTIDKSQALHASRLLILLQAFVDKDGKGGEIEGLTKLAKLDFLLRYPLLLHRALEAKGHSSRGVNLLEHEYLCVESKMVRYKFGPWDHDYKEYLNILVAKGLATMELTGRKVTIKITLRGGDVAKILAANHSFEQYAIRSKILKKHFNLTGTNLMKFIYQTFPEVISLRSNTSISI